MNIRGKWTYLTFLLYGLLALVIALTSESPIASWGVVLIVVAFVLAGLIYYFDLHRPAQTIKVLKMEAFKKQLPFFLTLACLYMRNEFKIPQLRCSLMLTRHRFFGGWQPLQIDVHDGNYVTVELEQSYKYNVGCCGTALAEKKQMFFDSEKAREPYKGMSETQRMATSHLKSILSTPIFSPADPHLKKPVAILNMDSEAPLRQTLFNKSKVQESAKKFAGLIGTFIT